MAPFDKLMAGCRGSIHLARPRNGRTRSGKALCPAHADRRPSLDVDELGDGRVLVCCRAGCSIGEIVSALGIETSDLFPERPRYFDDRLREARASVSPAVVLRSLDAAIGRAALLAAVYGQAGMLGEDHRQELLAISGSIRAARRSWEVGR